MAWHGMGSDGMGWRVYVFGVHDIMLPCYCMVRVCHFGLRVGGVYTSDFLIQSSILLIRYRVYWIRESTTTYKVSMSNCFLPEIQ